MTDVSELLHQTLLAYPLPNGDPDALIRHVRRQDRRRRTQTALVTVAAMCILAVGTVVAVQSLVISRTAPADTLLAPSPGPSATPDSASDSSCSGPDSAEITDLSERVAARAATVQAFAGMTTDPCAEEIHVALTDTSPSTIAAIVGSDDRSQFIFVKVANTLEALLAVQARIVRDNGLLARHGIDVRRTYVSFAENRVVIAIADATTEASAYLRARYGADMVLVRATAASDTLRPGVFTATMRPS